MDQIYSLGGRGVLYAVGVTCVRVSGYCFKKDPGMEVKVAILAAATLTVRSIERSLFEKYPITGTDQLLVWTASSIITKLVLSKIEEV